MVKKVVSFFKWIYVILLTTASIFPLLWVLMSSFKTNAEILDSALALPKNFSFQGYITAFEMSPLLEFYGNSIVISVASTLVNIFIFGMAAYVIARYDFKFKNIIILIMSMSLLVPGTAIIQPIYSIVNTLNIYDTKIALILVYAALGLPTTLFVLRSYFLSIPKEMEESAAIDGAGFFTIFRKIIIPLAKPGFATAGVLQFLLAWNEFLYALVLTNSKHARTIPLALGYFKSQFSFDYRALFAAIVIISVPSIVAFVALQEQVVDSLAAGSVKG